MRCGDTPGWGDNGRGGEVGGAGDIEGWEWVRCEGVKESWRERVKE
jgi:hypothetical protein